MRGIIHSMTFISSLVFTIGVATGAQATNSAGSPKVTFESCVADYLSIPTTMRLKTDDPQKYLNFKPTECDQEIDLGLDRLGQAVNAEGATSVNWGGNLENARKSINLLASEMYTQNGTWLTARNGWEQDTLKKTKIEGEIKDLYINWKSFRGSPPQINLALTCAGLDKSDPIQAILSEKCKSIEDVDTSIAKNKETAKTSYSSYTVRRDVLIQLAQRYRASGAAFQPLQAASVALRKTAGPSNSINSDCNIDTDESRRLIIPNDCTDLDKNMDGKGLKRRPTLYSDYAPIPSAVISPRGLTTRYSVGKSGDELSLKYTREFNLRAPYTPGEIVQKQAQWGLAAGLASSNDEGQILNLGERKETPFHEPLDRLDSDTKGSLNIFYKSYDAEDGDTFDRRGQQMQAAALKACLENQSTAAQVASSCEGVQLVQWMMHRDAKGQLSHPVHAKAFGDLYFGRPKDAQLPVWGVGAEATIGFPSFEYVDEVEGQPPENYTFENIIRDRQTVFSIKPFAFYRLTKSDNEKIDASIFGSLTYGEKRPFEDSKRKTGKLCEDEDSKDCETFVIGAPIKVGSWDPSLQLRMNVKNPPWGLPQFGLAPKALYSDYQDRWEFEMPLYFVSASSKQFNAGVAFKHRTKGENEVTNEELEKETGLYLFLTSTFNLDGL